MTGELDIEIVKPFRPALRYHGGKWAIAPWIISHLPEHLIYVEPFCGAASILLRKERSRVETINDLDDEVINLFRILRSPEAALALARLIELTPFGRTEFQECYLPSADALERARRLVARSYMGFGSHSHNIDNSNGFRGFIAGRKRYAIEFANLPDALMALVARLQGVIIENRPALEIIGQNDSTDTLFFLDPPYPASTRDCNGKGYCHEMTDHDHRLLGHFLRTVKGKVVLCGYPCSLYDEELFTDWRRVTRKAYASGQKGKVARTEVLWMNF